MALFYLETSALAKRYKREQGSNIIDSVFEDRSADDRLVTSYLAPVELAGAATRIRKSGTLTILAYASKLVLNYDA